MKINKIFAATLVAVSVAATLTTGCDESELYSADAPEWIADSVSAVAARNAANGGAAAFAAETVVSDGWWSAWSKNYSFPENNRMTIEVTLDKSTREELWKNWAMVVATSGWNFPSSGEPNGQEGYGEYFVVRGDGGNWNGKGKVSVTTTDAMPIADAAYKDFEQDDTKYVIVAEHYPTGSILIKCSQVNPAGEEYHWTANGLAEAGAGCQVFFAGEGSTFTITNITYETLEELSPAAIAISGTPAAVEKYTGEEPVAPSYYFGDGVATITWDNGATSSVGADELSFTVIPDLSTVGTATVAVAYGKTSMGRFCEPVATSYQVEVTNAIKSIEAKCKVNGKNFYYYDLEIPLKSDQFEVTATYADGTSGVLAANNVKFAVTTDGKVTATYNDITSEVSNVTATKGSSAAGDLTYPSWIATNFGSVASGESKTVKVFVYTAGTADWQCALPEISGTSANGGWTLCFNGNNWGFGDPSTMTATLVKNDFFIEGVFDHAMRGAEAALGIDYTIVFTNNGDGTANISETGTTSDGVSRTISLDLGNVPETINIDVTIDGAYAIFHD